MSTLEFLKDNSKWLGAGALLTFMSSFGQTFFISLFAGEIRADFELSHGDWGAIYSVGTGLSALVMVWAGGLTDQFRARSIGSLVFLGLAIGCLLMAVNTVTLGLFAVVFLLRLTGQGMTSHVAVVAMARWFVATRGRALSIATLGFTLGEFVLPLSFVSLMAVLDWRWLWVIAALMALAGIPILRRLLHTERTPQSIAEELSSPGMLGLHWERKMAISHPLFWFMIPTILGQSAFNTAFFFHQVHFADLKGITHFGLVALFPIYTALAVLAMIVSGWALDKWGTARLIPFYQIPMVIGFVLFAYAGSIWGLVCGLVFIAITSGANMTLPNAFWADFYGTRFIGGIKALAAAIMVLGSALGPLVTGWLIDAGIDLDVQYIWIGAFFLFTTVCIWIGVARYKGEIALR